MAVVTISRQAGSSGEDVARILSAKTGYELIDGEKVHHLAADCDEEYKDACSAFEAETFSGFFERLVFNRSSYRSLFESLNLELASRDNVILLGRGAQFVLRTMPGIFFARIVAPFDIRARTILAQKNLPERESLEYLRNQDERRRAMLKSIYRDDIDDPLLYDLVLNSANYKAEAAAEIMEKAITRKNGMAPGGLPAQKIKRMAFAKRVESVIRKNVRAIPDLEGVKVDCPVEGEVTLSGIVGTERDVTSAQEAAENFAGVCRVTNKLQVVTWI